MYLDNYFCSLCFAARCCASFKCALLSASDCFVFASARLYDSVHSQHNNFPSTFNQILIITTCNPRTYPFCIKMNYFLIFVLSVKGTLLFALLTSDWWPITFFRICTSLTFTTNKCSYGIAIFTGRWLTIGFHILLAFLTNSACITLSVKNKIIWRNTKFIKVQNQLI